MTERFTYTERNTSQESKRSLRQASIEVFPSETIAERVINAFGGSALKVNVTSSPNRGIESTLKLSELLVQNGFDVVPHIGAQKIRDKEHLGRIAGQITELGIDEIFLIKGEGEQTGEYKTSTHLMKDLATMGTHFRAIGIAGYPEGMEGMTDEQVQKGLASRERVAKSMGSALYVVTQMCFDAEKIKTYAEDLKSNHPDVGLVIGLPVPEKNNKLYDIATRCRVGESRESLRGGDPDGEYQPQELVKAIESRGGKELISGYHVYSFNKTKRLAHWFNDVTV